MEIVNGGHLYRVELWMKVWLDRECFRFHIILFYIFVVFMFICISCLINKSSLLNVWYIDRYKFSEIIDKY